MTPVALGPIALLALVCLVPVSGGQSAPLARILKLDDQVHTTCNDHGFFGVRP